MEPIYIKTKNGIKKVSQEEINMAKRGRGPELMAIILKMVDQEPGLTQGQMAKKLGKKSGASINPILRKMVEAGQLIRLGYPYQYYKVVPGPKNK